MFANRGFTYLELFITLALLSLLTSLAAPSLYSLIASKDGERALRSISELIMLARSEAAKTGQIATLCPSSSGNQCGGTWASGAMLFLDHNGDRKINQPDRILRVKFDLSRQGKVIWRAFGNRQYLQIDSRGFLRHQSGNFTYCDVNGDPRLAHQLVINSAGRLRLAQDSDGDGIRENSQDNALTCD